MSEPEEGLVIESYEDKSHKEKRFRWRVREDGDIQMTSSDAYLTMDDAEKHAKHLLGERYTFTRID